MILDADLLVGRDIATGTRVEPSGLAAALAEAGIDGGVVTSLRALSFDVVSGNDEAIAAAAGRAGWTPAGGLDLRDPLGGEREIDRLAGLGVRAVRFAHTRQEVPPDTPGLRRLAERATARGMVLLVEGDVRLVGPPLTGIGARAVFVDTHFYHLGDFVILARDEPGFHTATRLLGSPDAWDVVARSVGAGRLVFGARTPWYEAAAGLRGLVAAGLSDADAAAVAHGALTRLLRAPGTDGAP